jgi:hypothetical protein
VLTLGELTFHLAKICDVRHARDIEKDFRSTSETTLSRDAAMAADRPSLVEDPLATGLSS